MTQEPPKTIVELLARYAAGERDFVGAELDYRWGDLSGVVLDDADLSRCWFNASFEKASLKRVNFRSANVKCCDFSGADLSDADFSKSALEATQWRGAILTRTRFGPVSVYGAQLTEAQFLASIED